MPSRGSSLLLGGLAAVAVLAIAGGALAYRQHQTDQLWTRAALLAKGDPHAGRTAIETYQCGGCHMIPGARNATGKVGPSLQGFAGRMTVAGVLSNEPDSLVRWIRTPQAVVPGNAMPNLGVGERDARNMAAYLYTLK